VASSTPDAPRRASRRPPFRVRWLASAATLGAFAAVAVAAVQLAVAWRAQEATVNASLARYAAYAAKVAGEGVERRFADVSYRTLAPIIGARASRDGAPIPLDRFADFARLATAESPQLDADSALGFFRIAPGDRTGATATTIGVGPVATDEMLRAIALLALPPNETVWPGLATGNLTPHTWRGHHIIVDAAWQYGADGRRTGLYGITRDERVMVTSATAIIHRWQLLLPPLPFVGATASATPLSRADAGRLNLQYVALRVRDPGGGVLWTSPNWTRADMSASPFRASYAGGYGGDAERSLIFDAVLEPGLRRLVEDSAAQRLSRLLLFAVLLFAIGLAVVAVVGHRRQRALANARERFVAAVSHELRTPLAQIRMFSELLSDDKVRSPEQRQRWLAVIHREAIRLGTLVENVLVFARGEALGLTVSPRETDAVLLARDALGAFAPLASGRGVTLRAELPDRAPIWADPDAVRQVVGNLLDNAVKYGPEGQTVTVRVRQREGPRGEVALAVDDEGGGVPPADRERVWERYTRLHHDGTTGGSGLGLSLVRELIVRQGGRAWVENAPNGGARFVVTLPSARPVDDGPG
jgi:signal transduction histidine kinase